MHAGGLEVSLYSGVVCASFTEINCWLIAQKTSLNIFLLASRQLLAGAQVNELTKHRQTALHLAAQQDLPTICSVLLENGVDFAAVDENGNNGKLFKVLQVVVNSSVGLFMMSPSGRDYPLNGLTCQR